MTIEEFDKVGFCAGMVVTYCGCKYDVISVNFPESLFGLALDDDNEDLMWVRCENVNDLTFKNE